MNRPRLGRSVSTPALTPTTTVQGVVPLDGSSQVIVQASVTAEDMDVAVAAGHATHLSVLITDFILFQKQWWIAYGGHWLRIDDGELISLLMAQHQRFSDTS
jgi:hypothetical protein